MTSGKDKIVQIENRSVVPRGWWDGGIGEDQLQHREIFRDHESVSVS